MAVSSTDTRIEYNGNGATTAFATGFVFLAASDLEVYLDGVLQTITTHYTVSGGNGASGTVTFVTAPGSGKKVLIYRNVPLTQGTDYQENEKFPADTHERGLDKLTMIAQQITETFGRALKFAKTSTLKDIDVPEGTSAANRANKHFRWNAAGTLLELVTVGVDAVTGLITTRGDLLRGSSSGAPERLPLGAANKVVKSDGTDVVYGDVDRGSFNGTLLTFGATADGKVVKRSGTSLVTDDVTALKESGGQVLSIGAVADGQALQRSGTSVVGAGLIKLKAVTVFTASGTWTKPSGLDSVVVVVVGGGGGGGLRTSDGAAAGGGGGTAIKRIAAASLGATEAVTVGAGGNGKASGSAGAGSTGGTSSFGSHCSATGGGGGAEAGVGGAGGTGSGGDINITGQSGCNAGPSSHSGTLGPGGSSTHGGGGTGGFSSTPAGNGGNYGGGGGGGNGTTNNAGNGAGGIVIVYEYGA